jgi:hypothetical protein
MAHVAVIRLRNQNGELLILLRNTRPFGHCLPGGKIDAGETSSEAALRELGEETGISTIGITLTFVGTMKSFDDKDVDIFDGYYDTSSPTATPIKLNKREHMSYRWTKDFTGLAFAGNTKDFIECGTQHMPEALSRTADRLLMGMALDKIMEGGIPADKIANVE